MHIAYGCSAQPSLIDSTTIRQYTWAAVTVTPFCTARREYTYSAVSAWRWTCLCFYSVVTGQPDDVPHRPPRPPCNPLGLAEQRGLVPGSLLSVVPVSLALYSACVPRAHTAHYEDPDVYRLSIASPIYKALGRSHTRLSHGVDNGRKARHIRSNSAVNSPANPLARLYMMTSSWLPFVACTVQLNEPLITTRPSTIANLWCIA